MESGDKMTEEERRKWIGVLLDKVLTIHEQGKHYVSLDINNLDYSIMVTVTAIKHGVQIEGMISINTVLWILVQKNFQ